MSHPDLVESRLDGEEAVATVNLSGEDVLVITPTRSLHYQGEGILSDESVTEYPHEDVTAIDVSSGRRKATIRLVYPIDGERTLSVAKNRQETVLHYLLAGVFHAKGITGPGESLQSVFQFNELTLAVTSERVLTHVGSRVWDEEYDEYPFAHLTGLSFEEGSIATEMVLYLEDRTQRVKVPNARAEEVKRALEEAIVAYFDVDSLEAFQRTSGVPDQDTTGSDAGGLAFDDAVRPLGADPVDSEPREEAGQAGVSEAGTASGDGADVDVEELVATVQRLERQLAEQRDLLEAQEAALADLAEQLAED